MATRVTELQIRVYPLVMKFLAYHYDTAPFLLGYVRNPYATYLEAQLIQFDKRDKRELPKKYARLTERLSVGISKAYRHNYGNVCITPYRESAFNDFVKQMFLDKLTSEVAIHTGLGVGLRTAIQTFLDRYAITEDELAIKTAIEYFYRATRKAARENGRLANPVAPTRTLAHATPPAALGLAA